MATASQTEVLQALGTLVEPKLKWNILSLNLVKNLEVSENRVDLEIHLVTQEKSEQNQFQRACQELLAGLGFEEVNVTIGQVHIAVEGVSGVDHIVLVGSGKGGVGKSTTAVNLAMALKRFGYNVGLMDADIHGPSIPTMLGVDAKPEVLADEYLLPVKAHGLQVMSIGLLMPPGKAIPWRAQLVTGTIVQFIQKTFWDTLNYLVVDLPPGTGDVQLTIAQRVKAKGIVVVSAPQEVVLGDVRRSIDLYREKQIPILSLVENMSGLVCENCGHEMHPFVAAPKGLEGEFDHYFRVPLDAKISQSGDSGVPLPLAYPEHPAVEVFENLAQAVLKALPPGQQKSTALN